MQKRLLTNACTLALAATLSACAVQRPVVNSEDMPAPAAWLAPVLPHNASAQALADWWGRWQDPTLVAWIAQAQQRSATVADARARVAQARAQALAQDTLTGPQLMAVGSASRGVSAQAPLATTVSAGLQASWALDVWGDGRAAVSQAQAQQSAAQAGWHVARVLVAAELAQTYFARRACERLLQLARSDLVSRQTSASALAQARDVGLVAGAQTSLADADVAQAREREARQAQQCDSQTKALVALTGLSEAEVQQALQAQGSPAMQDASLQAIEPLLLAPAVPAAALRQRPDVWQAQWTLAAAADGVGIAQAQLWPSLSLSASWLRHDVRHAAKVTSWSLGPLAVNVPLVERDALHARAEAANVSYEAAQVAYNATLRRAVSEVEQALVAQHALQQRRQQAAATAEAMRQVDLAAQQSLRAGLTSGNDAQDARRQWLGAQSAAVALQLEQLNAAVALYVALGGGYDAAQAQDLNRELP